MKRVRVYSTDYCGYCTRAKQLLDRLHIPYEEIDVTDDPAMRRTLVEWTGLRTVPQIFIGDESIGGYTDLAALHRDGQLSPLLEEDAQKPQEDTLHLRGDDQQR